MYGEDVLPQSLRYGTTFVISPGSINVPVLLGFVLPALGGDTAHGAARGLAPCPPEFLETGLDSSVCPYNPTGLAKALLSS